MPTIPNRRWPGGTRFVLLASILAPAAVVAVSEFLSQIQRSPDTLGALQRGLGRASFAGGSVLLLMLTISATIWHLSWRRGE